MQIVPIKPVKVIRFRGGSLLGVDADFGRGIAAGAAVISGLIMEGSGT
jgi:hypothetical protein